MNKFYDITWRHELYWSLENVYQSLDNFKISKIEIFANISLSPDSATPINSANVCRKHWNLVTWLWHTIQGLYSIHFSVYGNWAIAWYLNFVLQLLICFLIIFE